VLSRALVATLALGLIVVVPGPGGSRTAAPLLVSVKPDGERLMHEAGAQELSRGLGIWRVDGASAGSVVSRLRDAGLLRYAEPERPRRRLGRTVPRDPLFAGQWWLTKIGADELEPPIGGVPVTIVDSGIDGSHPEFAGRPRTVALNAQTTTDARGFHGTAVASILAAPENGIGLVGVHPGVELRSWDASPGAFFTSADVIAGIASAASLGRGVVNVSIGGLSRSRAEADAVADAFRRGTIVVAAGGNERPEGSPPSYPASLPHVVTVGATTSSDLVAGFSSASTALDVVAPGEGIVAAVPERFDPSGYRSVSGTSFAAPMVAGAIAWLWTARPELEKTQVIELLRRTAIDLGPRGRDPDTGFGLLDLRAALTARAPPIDPLEPNDEVDDAVEALAITAPGRPAATVRARLDVDDDPRDVYSVWLPARRRVLLRTDTAAPRVLALGRRGAGVRLRYVHGGLALENRSGAGKYVQATVFLPLGTPKGYTSYRLKVEPMRLRPGR
jgi:hypothetical protein